MQLHHLKRECLPKGFILGQFIGSLALIGSICFLSGSFFLVYERAAVRREVDRLYAAMLYMQRKAIIEGVSCSVLFDGKGQGYTADAPHRLGTGVKFGASAGVKGPPSRALCVIKECCTWPNGVCAFYPDGTISAGAIYLTDRRNACTYALTCDASETSHIRRYLYDGSWKLL